jgi:ribosomal protein S27AE
VGIQRGIDGPDPVNPEPVSRGGAVHEERRVATAGDLATGTLACPRCDAPILLARPARPSDRLGCGFCSHAGAVRDFLSLGEPTRPARVRVRVRLLARR